MTKDQIAVLNKALETNKTVDLIKLSDKLISIYEQLDGGYDPSDSEALLLVAHMLRNKALVQEPIIQMRDATPEELEAVDNHIKSISRSTGVSFWNSDSESFINKPCISSGVCEHDKINTLNKLRDKIEKYRSTIDRAISEDESKIEGMKEAYTDCIGMIDEYISEMENDND